MGNEGASTGRGWSPPSEPSRSLYVSGSWGVPSRVKEDRANAAVLMPERVGVTGCEPGPERRGAEPGRRAPDPTKERTGVLYQRRAWTTGTGPGKTEEGWVTGSAPRPSEHSPKEPTVQEPRCAPRLGDTRAPSLAWRTDVTRTDEGSLLEVLERNNRCSREDAATSMPGSRARVDGLRHAAAPAALSSCHRSLLSALRMGRNHTGTKFVVKVGKDSERSELARGVSSEGDYSLRAQQTVDSIRPPTALDNDEKPCKPVPGRREDSPRSWKGK